MTIRQGQPRCVPRTAAQGSSILSGLPPSSPCFPQELRGVPHTGMLALLPSRTSCIRRGAPAGQGRWKQDLLCWGNSSALGCCHALAPYARRCSRALPPETLGRHMGSPKPTCHLRLQHGALTFPAGSRPFANRTAASHPCPARASGHHVLDGGGGTRISLLPPPPQASPLGLLGPRLGPGRGKRALHPRVRPGAVSGCRRGRGAGGQGERGPEAGGQTCRQEGRRQRREGGEKFIPGDTSPGRGGGAAPSRRLLAPRGWDMRRGAAARG